MLSREHRSWREIDSLSLHAHVFGCNGYRAVIRVHRGRRKHLLTPACGFNRANLQFARMLRSAAQLSGGARRLFGGAGR